MLIQIKKNICIKIFFISSIIFMLYIIINKNGEDLSNDNNTNTNTNGYENYSNNKKKVSFANPIETIINFRTLK
tara:strand:+ start:156 stop:377 length:222 start_codon:yes stop_codon:yes gene_type:complete